MANELRFRADHVGLLVPPEGESDIDAKVKALIAMQRAAGVAVATDGELRRNNLAERMLAGPVAIAAEEEAQPLLAVAGMDVKVSLPAASALMVRTGASAEAAVTAVRREVAALQAAGVQYVQLNGTGYGPLLDSGGAIDMQVEADLAVADGFAGKENTRLALRVGREGASPVWDAADPRLAALFATGYDRYLLDFGTAPGGFEVLRLVPEGVMAVLGLIDSVAPDVQAADPVLDAIDAAAEIKDGNDLALSPRGGFSAKSGIGWVGQQKKLQQVADMCVRWWGFAR